MPTYVNRLLCFAFVNRHACPPTSQKKKLVKLQKFSTLVDALQSRISALNYF